MMKGRAILARPFLFGVFKPNRLAALAILDSLLKACFTKVMNFNVL